MRDTLCCFSVSNAHGGRDGGPLWRTEGLHEGGGSTTPSSGRASTLEVQRPISDVPDRLLMVTERTTSLLRASGEGQTRKRWRECKGGNVPRAFITKVSSRLIPTIDFLLESAMDLAMRRGVRGREGHGEVGFWCDL